MAKPVALSTHRGKSRSSAAVPSALLVAAAVLGLTATCAGTQFSIPRTARADDVITEAVDEHGAKVVIHEDVGVPPPPEVEHRCMHDTPVMQDATFAIHSPEDVEQMYSNCDPKLSDSMYCVAADGTTSLRGVSVVPLETTEPPQEEGGAKRPSERGFRLQSGREATMMVTPVNYTSSGHIFAPADIGKFRLNFRLDNLYDNTKYCTTSTGSTVNFLGGTEPCSQAMIFTNARRDYLVNRLLPRCREILESALSVDRVQGNLVIPSSSVCGNQYRVAATDIRPGLADTDTAIFVTVAPSSTGAAWALYCAQDSNGRPTIGRINITPTFLDGTSASQLENAARVVTHEIIHALGFSGALFNTNQFRNGYVKKSTRRGQPVTLLVGPSILAKAREIYNCPTLDGVELEDEGVGGTAGSHWERRTHKEDVLAGVTGSVMTLSELTFAALEDSGHYFVDYSAVEKTTLMRGYGCGVFDSTCMTQRGGLGKYYCDGTGPSVGCSFMNMAVGYCSIGTYPYDLPSYNRWFTDPRKGGSISLMNYCPIIVGYGNMQCNITGSSANSRVSGSYYGPGGRCLITSLNLIMAGYSWGGGSPGPARCLRTRCSKMKSVEFKFTEEMAWIKCPADGSEAVIDVKPYGYDGTVTCPNPVEFCTPDLCYDCEPPTTTTTTPKPTTTTTTTPKPTTTTTTTPKPTTTTTTTPKPTTTTTTPIPTTTTPAFSEPPTPSTPPASCDSYRLNTNAPSPSSTLSVSQINQILDLHNRARQTVSPYARAMPMLQWSQDLADFAKEYVSTCPPTSQKSPISRRLNNGRFPQWAYIGENMAAGSGITPDNLQAIFNAWMEGATGYSYPDCLSGYCGAYLQVVWAQTTHIGCAVQSCPNSPYPYYWVCNYGLGGGNVDGATPYDATSFISDTAVCTSDRYVAKPALVAADDCERSYFVSGTVSRSITLSNNDINIILKGHNDERRAVYPLAADMPMLQWSQDLANFAHDYVSTCPGLRASAETRREDPKEFPQWWYVGENLVAGHNLSSRFVSDMVKAWAAGGQGYQYPATCASGVYCVPYRQMIWADTTHVGCAYSYCPTSAANTYPYLWACNYGVGGSITGRAPYNKSLGTPASCTSSAAAARTKRRVYAEAQYMDSIQQAEAAANANPKSNAYMLGNARKTMKGASAEGAPKSGSSIVRSERRRLRQQQQQPLEAAAYQPPALSADTHALSRQYQSAKERVFREMSQLDDNEAVLVADVSPYLLQQQAQQQRRVSRREKERSRPSREESTRRRSRMAEARENARIARINQAMLNKGAMGIVAEQEKGDKDTAGQQQGGKSQEENFVDEH